MKKGKELDIGHINQMINRMNGDLLYFTKLFNQDTLKKINESELKIYLMDKQI